MKIIYYVTYGNVFLKCLIFFFLTCSTGRSSSIAFWDSRCTPRNIHYFFNSPIIPSPLLTTINWETHRHVKGVKNLVYGEVAKPGVARNAAEKKLKKLRKTSWKDLFMMRIPPMCLRFVLTSHAINNDKVIILCAFRMVLKLDGLKKFREFFLCT